MRHGYTNDTRHLASTVRKSYRGPDAMERATAERLALRALAGLFPVPPVIADEQEAIVTGFVDGEHGQDLIDAGHARQVLTECGRVLRRLHALDSALLDGHQHSGVIQHGDFGPNNVMFDRTGHHIVAVLDWEFSQIGPPITDLAWCEWIVRMHHPDAAGELAAFFDAYGRCPSWAHRQEEMLRRCAWLEDFSRRWDPHGDAARTWQHRAAITSRWVE